MAVLFMILNLHALQGGFRGTTYGTVDGPGDHPWQPYLVWGGHLWQEKLPQMVWGDHRWRDKCQGFPA